MATKRAVKTVKKTPVKKASKKASKNPFAPAARRKPLHGTDDHVHLLKKGFICDTEQKGFTRPKGKSTIKIVVDAEGGFVRLWTKNVTLNWRFRESSMDYFDDPTSAKKEIRTLIKEMLAQWGTAS